MAGDSSAWIRRFHPAPDAPTRLVCLPHAGGSAPFFFPVSQHMSPSVDVIAIQYPGRLDRRHEPCVETIGELADQLFGVLTPLLDRPVVLFGHSMGASVGFEVARRMEREGTVPLGLFVSGRRAPSRQRNEGIHLRDDDGLIAELKRLGGTEAQVLGNEELMRMVLPTIRSDYRAAETYRWAPGPPLTCPVFALIGDEDPRVDTDDAKAWGDHTIGPFQLTVFPGGHFYINDHAMAVMDAIERHIREGLAGQSARGR